MDDALTQRVEALERAVTDGDHDLSALADDAAALDRLDDVESRLDRLETQVEELEAATQALRGYVGNVRSVNQRVETRADTALAKAESLADRLAADTGADGPHDRHDDSLSGQPTQNHHRPTAPQQGEATTGGSDRTPGGAETPADSGGTHTATSQSPAPAGGGVASSDTDQAGPDSRNTHRCQACGRTRRDADDGPATGATRESAPTGTAEGADVAEQPPAPETPFDVEEPDETTRLQRFRELL